MAFLRVSFVVFAWLPCCFLSEPSMAFGGESLRFAATSRRPHRRIAHHPVAAASVADEAEEVETPTSVRANWALLISSWTDGVAGSIEAKAFLKQGLAIALLSEQQRHAELAVESSALQSPCCGPSVDALQSMESVDRAIDMVKTAPDRIDSVLEQQLAISPRTLRLVYIPTAMYALRVDSTRTPGKQRQRARADGKKRRNDIVRTLQSLFEDVQVAAVTLDVDDGSIKQPEGFDDERSVPMDGNAALVGWAPHFVYVEGGNTFFLHHCLVKGDWVDILKSAITRRHGAVYCGKSAGAILAGESVETATWKGWDDPRVVPDMESYEDWRGVKGLDVVAGKSIFPHMNEEWEGLIEEKRKDMESGDVLCLRDDEVICVNGSEQRIARLSCVVA